MSDKVEIGNHTPGPWVADAPQAGDKFRNIISDAGTVAKIELSILSSAVRSTQEADAVLIACAPAMHRACYAAVCHFLGKGENITDAEIDLVRSLLDSYGPYSLRKNGCANARFEHAEVMA